MVSKDEMLSITRQCMLLKLARSTYYYVPEPVSDEELELMRLIDQCYLELPFCELTAATRKLFNYWSISPSHLPTG